MKKETRLLHLYLLGGLIIIFFGILFLATVFKDVSTTYEFVESIDVLDQNSLKLGTVEIENHGFMSARVDLKVLVACSFDRRNVNAKVVYSSVDVNRKVSVEGNYNFIEYLDMKANSKEIVQLSIPFYEMNPRMLDKPTTQEFDKEFTLYLFELESDYGYYYFCDTASKDSAIETIDVKIVEQ